MSVTGVCEVYEYFYEPGESSVQPATGTTININVVELPYDSEDKLWSGEVFSISPDVDGKWSIFLPYGAVVKFECLEFGIQAKKTIPSVSSVRYSDIE